MNTDKKRSERASKYSPIIYAAIDFIVVAALTVITFFAAGAMDGATVNMWIGMVLYTFVISFLTVLLFLVFGIYGVVPRSFGAFDYARMVVVASAVQFIGLIPLEFVPNDFLNMGEISTRIFSSLLVALLLPLSRFAIVGIRILANIIFRRDKIRTLVIGAGGSAKVYYNETINNRSVKNKIIVIVDDDPNKIGGNFSGIPVKGPISDVAKIIDFYEIEEVVIAISDLTQDRLREILDYLEPCMVRVRRMPLLSEMSGPNDTKVIDVDVTEL